ncbi:ATP-binding protein [Legionella oakridgensis]|uniref:Histidine kinase/HSP90-like ATPase domain-containing protein n=1 Tax=Legionella oakridgensis TaxID=29423 RepID=A0A0W0X598_9GAMM|nr:ATP-binding protein [Legionella oakridgensis]KTD39774.1 hypothetical protein Loak_0881 [Legionella oakridgensis]STY19995.1 Uncharacterised protein [Legionella longbeachae]
MPLHEETTFKIDLSSYVVISREIKQKLADEVLGKATLFLNEVKKVKNLNLPTFPDTYDPGHESRWLYFFLRETIRNSFDAFFSQEKTSAYLEIKITIATNITGQTYLKVKDNGSGFKGVEKSVPFLERPASSEKDRRICLGGKGLGLSICQGKLGSIIFKNRKEGGASVKTALGLETDLILEPKVFLAMRKP